MWSDHKDSGPNYFNSKSHCIQNSVTIFDVKTRDMKKDMKKNKSYDNKQIDISKKKNGKKEHRLYTKLLSCAYSLNSRVIKWLSLNYKKLLW